MINVHSGQCGVCAHFGEHHPDAPELVQIRQTKKAPEDLVEDCGHPKNKVVSLKVTPASSCDGFEPADAN